MSAVDRIQAVVQAALDDTETEVVDVEVTPGLLRISVDCPGGIDLDALGEASRAISAALDISDPMPGRYTLEVGSPGLERPLRTPEHFQRFVGSMIAVKTKPGSAGLRRAQGRLEAADDKGITMTSPDLGHEPLRLTYDDIDKARTVFEWGTGAPSGLRSAPAKRKPSTKKAAIS
ncbi:MAG: ribosome maturation factor RimP [Acidimicrobiales bacterium]